ncbi:MAG: hypothetical protein DRG78_00530 [Epsilonproteobacteria bacterium]|nr:MAG: hypothetical protein DRG78_00530 [Campylobacterota bacterium]
MTTEKVNLINQLFDIFISVQFHPDEYRRKPNLIIAKRIDNDKETDIYGVDIVYYLDEYKFEFLSGYFEKHEIDSTYLILENLPISILKQAILTLL